MSKPRKVIRSKTIYKHKRRGNRKIGRVLLWVAFFLLLLGVGFLFMKGLEKFRANQQAKPASSQVTPSSDPASSEPEPVTVSLDRVFSLSGEEICSLTEEALSARLKEAASQGYTAVTFELKQEDGYLSFLSENAMAAKYQTVRPDAKVLDTLILIAKGAGLKPMASLSALKDAVAPAVQRENSFAFLGNPAINWLDNKKELGGKRWLNPYMENARLYLADLCREVAGRGVEGIFLSNVCFPSPYISKMDTLIYEPERPVILHQLLEEVQAAAGEVPVYRVVPLKELLNQAEGTLGGVVPGYRKLAPSVDLVLCGGLSVETDERGSRLTAHTVVPSAQVAVDSLSVLLRYLQESTGAETVLFPMLTMDAAWETGVTEVLTEAGCAGMVS